mmetsp:Transcript_3960/g.3553  ORF Transcript_3960/g.3553 Transcript_3960/m.3553 type:complete len:178 (-) Transcript_3960:8-541(-)
MTERRTKRNTYVKSENEFKKIKRETNFKTHEISDEVKKFIKTLHIADDDPALGIMWNDEILIELIRRINNGEIIDLPERPNYIYTNTITAFKDGIIAHLGEFGGGCRYNFIAPNDMDQYGDVLTRLRDIELNPFIQVLRQHIDHSLAYCVKIADKKNVTLVPINRRAPPHPYLQVFD